MENEITLDEMMNAVTILRIDLGIADEEEINQFWKKLEADGIVSFEPFPEDY